MDLKNHQRECVYKINVQMCKNNNKALVKNLN